MIYPLRWIAPCTVLKTSRSVLQLEPGAYHNCGVNFLIECHPIFKRYHPIFKRYHLIIYSIPGVACQPPLPPPGISLVGYPLERIFVSKMLFYDIINFPGVK